MIRSTLTSRWRKPERVDRASTGGPEEAGGGDRFHVAIIMDGNGRWAERQGRPRTAGHMAGAGVVRRTVESAPGLGITTLTLYAFSADNWRRPRSEVSHLMHLFRRHLDSESRRLTENGVRLSIIGRRDRLPESLKRRIVRVEELTREGTSLHLRIAIDYSARDALTEAAGRLATGVPPTRTAFEKSLCRAVHAPCGTRDVDLLIRTGGEQRLSDFLLWESAYAELVFMDVLWPDFTSTDLASAVEAFSERDRRFGGLSGASGRVADPAPLARRAAP